jgi:hypothetical protein
VLDIVYREGEETREVSIAAYDSPARQAFAVLQAQIVRLRQIAHGVGMTTLVGVSTCVVSPSPS